MRWNGKLSPEQQNLDLDAEQGKTLNRVFFLSDSVEVRKLCYVTMLYIVGYVKQNCWVYIAIGFITQLKRKKTNYLKHVRALHISWASVIVQLPYSQISKLRGYIFCSNLFFACRKQFPQYAGGRMLPSKPKSSNHFGDRSTHGPQHFAALQNPLGKRQQQLC